MTTSKSVILVPGDKETNSLSHTCLSRSSATDSLRNLHWPSQVIRRICRHRAVPSRIVGAMTSLEDALFATVR